MKKILFLLSMLMLTLSSSMAHADALLPINQDKWFIALDGGYRLSTINKGPDSVVQSGQAEPDLYVPSNISGSGVVDLSFGYRFYLNNVNWLPYDELGVRYQYASPTTIKGVVELSSLHDADNYDYNYALTQSTLLVTDKLALVKLGAFIPYILVGAGTSINQVSAYSETLVPPATQPRVGPGFSATSYAKIAYMGSLGVDINLSPQWKLNVAYEYDSPSTIQTGAGTPSDYPGVFLTNTVSNNEVTVGFEYLFNIKSFN